MRYNSQAVSVFTAIERIKRENGNQQINQFSHLYIILVQRPLFNQYKMHKPPKKPLDQLRENLRLKHYSIRTEES